MNMRKLVTTIALSLALLGVGASTAQAWTIPPQTAPWTATWGPRGSNSLTFDACTQQFVAVVRVGRNTITLVDSTAAGIEAQVLAVTGKPLPYYTRMLAETDQSAVPCV